MPIFDSGRFGSSSFRLAVAISTVLATDGDEDLVSDFGALDPVTEDETSFFALLSDTSACATRVVSLI